MSNFPSSSLRGQTTKYTLITKTNHTMLEYQKMILKKVGQDRSLFERELKKTILMLDAIEFREFKKWVFQQFSTQYLDILQRCFTTSRIAA